MTFVFCLRLSVNSSTNLRYPNLSMACQIRHDLSRFLEAGKLFGAFIQCGGFPGWRQWEARIEGACQKWMSGLIIAQHKWRARDRMWGWNQKEVSELKTLEWSTLGNKTNQALAQWWSWNCKVTVYSGCLQGLCLLWRGCQSWSERGVYEPRAKVFSEGKGATGD